MRPTFLIAVLLVWAGCAPTLPYARTAPDPPPTFPDGRTVATFYALGDWGTANTTQHRVAAMLAADMASLGDRRYPPFVLGAGDNVYPYGLPQGWGHPAVDSLLDATFGDVYDAVRYRGEPVPFHVVPGNHDYSWVYWRHFKKGWGDVIQQETAAEARYPGWWFYYPMSLGGGEDRNDRATYEALSARAIETVTLPEPVHTPPEAPLTLIAIDTQVLLDLYAKHDLAAVNRHLDRLAALLVESPQPWKMVLGHHPVLSYGEHGGYQNLRPGHPTDLGHRDYQAMRRDLKAILREHHAIYFSGHEHTLQLLDLGEGAYQVVSGSAGHGGRVTAKRETRFAHDAPGYARIDLTPTELWITFRWLGETPGQLTSFRIPAPSAAAGSSR